MQLQGQTAPHGSLIADAGLILLCHIVNVYNALILLIKYAIKQSAFTIIFGL
jgi:hypothetical protein